MTSESDEFLKREAAARKHIASIYGSPKDESGATLFVSHHLSEIDSAYWQKHTGSSKPEAQHVLDVLEVCVDPEEVDLDILDFSLPDAVTNYVISVEFDDSGEIATVSMES